MALDCSQPELSQASWKTDEAGHRGFLLKPASADDMSKAGKLELDGDESITFQIAELMDEFDPMFDLATP